MATDIKIGVGAVPIPYQDLLEAGVVCEELGYESMWFGEHIIMPQQISSIYPNTGGKAPFGHHTEFLEPFVAMGALGAVTKRLRFGTGIALFPLRDPYVLAREIMTADVLSKGRVEVGVGAGWCREEFDIIGQDWPTRFKRTAEMVDLMDQLFTARDPQFDGEYYKLPKAGFEPKPTQKPRPPVLMGGNTDVALRRVARVGDGWISSRVTPEFAARAIELLKRERGDNKPPLTFSIQAPEDADLEAYAKAGVERIIMTPWSDPKRWREGLEAFARKHGLRAATG